MFPFASLLAFFRRRAPGKSVFLDPGIQAKACFAFPASFFSSRLPPCCPFLVSVRPGGLADTSFFSIVSVCPDGLADTSFVRLILVSVRPGGLADTSFFRLILVSVRPDGLAETSFFD